MSAFANGRRHIPRWSWCEKTILVERAFVQGIYRTGYGTWEDEYQLVTVRSLGIRWRRGWPHHNAPVSSKERRVTTRLLAEIFIFSYSYLLHLTLIYRYYRSRTKGTLSVRQICEEFQTQEGKIKKNKKIAY